MTYNQTYEEDRLLVDKRLERIFDGFSDVPRILLDAMNYSLLCGGKRLRPVLMIETAKMFGQKYEDVLDLACAVEMIHTYSLIHDDLPGMDDDDMRRGRPSNHIVFGEGMAILAGDGLLNAAYEIMLKAITEKNFSPKYTRAVQCIAQAAGITGMIAGQCSDLESSMDAMDADSLLRVYRNKTGNLITASIMAGAIIAQTDQSALVALAKFADLLGLIFQITDDILDINGTQEETGKPVGSDKKNNKATIAALYGVGFAQQLVDDMVDQAEGILAQFGEKAWFLAQTVQMTAIRKR